MSAELECLLASLPAVPVPPGTAGLIRLSSTGDTIFLVQGGKIDLFATRLNAEVPDGPLLPLGRCTGGQLLLAPEADNPPAGWALVARPHGECRLYRFPWGPLLDWAATPEREQTLQAALADWHRCLQPEARADHASGPPIESANWCAAIWPQRIAAIEMAEAAANARLGAQARAESERLGEALGRLGRILHNVSMPENSGPASDDPLLAACRQLGREQGIEFRAPPGHARQRLDAVSSIAEASRVRCRRVGLRGSWWLQPGQPLLAFRKDGSPLALLPGEHGYVIAGHHPDLAVNAENAAEIEETAWVFHRSFGTRAQTLLSLLQFGSHGCTPDLLRIAALGLALGLIGLVTPLATGLLFDSVIPGADHRQLAQLSLGLLSAALAGSLFEITRGHALLRIENRMDSQLQAAVWDRLLRLPASFFRQYTAGDLASRAQGIHSIRQALSGQIMQTLLAAVFSSLNLALLFHYDTRLALLGLLLVAFAVAVTAGAGRLALHHERRLAEIEGRIAGQVFQYLGAIAKLRSAAAERRAFCNWAENYGQQQAHVFRARRVSTALEVFNSVYPLLANLLIFALVAFKLSPEQALSTGDFLAFSAAFGGFLTAMLGATGSLTGILDIVPLYERARPLLETPPEIAEGRHDPGELRGEIEIGHLCFRYSADGPPILNDIHLRIEPGEFVAVVGASGSGKSTLLRLLLGFEQPELGAIRYDGQDLASLDPVALRRQLGVVLQNGQLIAGDIFSNIIGTQALTLDDAWAAASQAGLADDIRAMPMGMHTVVSEGGGTLSGGQRQRLLIARAIVNRPRILFFDEATSALDNEAQAQVSRSLEALQATRIVIAHRLSTIMHADRILVLDAGRIVQSGTYATLIREEGLFADLARRQII